MAAQISDPYAAAAPIKNRGELRTNVGGRLEEERADILERRDPVPRLLLANLRESRIHAEELRMWGHRAFVREIRALKAECAGGYVQNEHNKC
jgi:hypothetical protein